jgi:hypothetical protein
MSNQSKKLELSKETLRGLDDEDLTGVVGGGGHGGGGGGGNSALVGCSVACNSAVVCTVLGVLC